MVKRISLLFLFFIFSYVFTPCHTPLPHRQNLRKFDKKCEKIELYSINIPQLILLSFILVSLFWLLLLNICSHVEYITFNTNLNLYKKKSNFITPEIWIYFLLMLSWLLLSAYPEDYCPNFSLLTKFNRYTD